MVYRIFADVIVFVHFIWILFMISVVVLTLFGFIWKKIFDMWLLRTVHFLGIIFVALLFLFKQSCPMTIGEYLLREQYDPTITYPGSFIVYYIEKFVYPDVNPVLMQILTISIAVITVIMFIIKPPEKIKSLLKKVLKKDMLQKNNQPRI